MMAPQGIVLFSFRRIYIIDNSELDPRYHSYIITTIIQMAPNMMQDHPLKEGADQEETVGNDNNINPPTASADYYAKGSAEAATEDAMTLAKIQHVSVFCLMGDGC